MPFFKYQLNFSRFNKFSRADFYKKILKRPRKMTNRSSNLNVIMKYFKGLTAN